MSLKALRSSPICDAMKASISAGGVSSDAEHAARKTQIGEMHGKAEPIGGAPALADQRQVFRREGVMPHDRRRLRRRIEQRCARLGGEDVTRGHDILLYGHGHKL